MNTVNIIKEGNTINLSLESLNISKIYNEIKELPDYIETHKDNEAKTKLWYKTNIPNIFVHFFQTYNGIGISFNKSYQTSPIDEKNTIQGLDVNVKLDTSNWIETWCIDNDRNLYKIKLPITSNSTVYDETFKLHKLVNMENVVKLNNGSYLINSHGKYLPNLTFLYDKPDFSYIRIEPKELNLPKGDMSILYGNFFISKKGTKCFRIQDNKKLASHILVSDDWGGCFNSYRGNTLPEEQAEYFRRARSNGGGSGVDYAIFPINWKYQLSEEDI